MSKESMGTEYQKDDWETTQGRTTNTAKLTIFNFKY
jgi:hypothetical protein